jgi:hypothetical protein
MEVFLMSVVTLRYFDPSDTSRPLLEVVGLGIPWEALRYATEHVPNGIKCPKASGPILDFLAATSRPGDTATVEQIFTKAVSQA